MSKPKSFKAKTTRSGWFTIISPMVILITVFLLIVPSRLELENFLVFFLVLLLPMLIIFFALLYLLIIYPKIQYRFDDNELIFTCGPFKKKILYSEIKKAFQRNFNSVPVCVGLNFPGFAITNANFADYGKITLWATRWNKNITVIETTTKSYGITPINEAYFLEILKEKTTID